jgi:hypothetical protein
MALARDLPAAWNAPSTDSQTKQRIPNPRSRAPPRPGRSCEKTATRELDPDLFAEIPNGLVMNTLSELDPENETGG